jgi:hypothetical protein
VGLAVKTMSFWCLRVVARLDLRHRSLPWSVGPGEFGSQGDDPGWRGGVVGMFDRDGGDAPWAPPSSLEAPSRSLLPAPISSSWVKT